MSTEIYFFSGTGNSLHVARELQKRIPQSKLIPMAGLMNRNVAMKTDTETVGFVFPVHMTALPVPIGNLIRKMDLTSAQYIFAVATRIGTQQTALKTVENILKKKGKRLDSGFTLNMPSNDPKFNYKPLTDEETAKLESAVRDKLEVIAAAVLNNEKNLDKDTTYSVRFPFLRLLSWMVILTDGIQQHFYANGKCNSCGICEKVCLSNKILMAGGKPIWRKKVKCYKCYACLNFCPAQSVQIKSHTEKNGRYSHPYATVEDIIGQK